MPQRVIVIYSCSLCSQEFEDSGEISPYKLSGGGRVLDLDVCTECETAHEGLRALLAAGVTDHTVKLPRKSAAKAPPPPAAQPAPLASTRIPCAYCDESFTPQGMALHQSKAHNVKAKKYRADGTGPHKCPECGFGAQAPQGLGAHRSMVHGIQASNGVRA